MSIAAIIKESSLAQAFYLISTTRAMNDPVVNYIDACRVIGERLNITLPGICATITETDKVDINEATLKTWAGLAALVNGGYAPKSPVDAVYQSLAYFLKSVGLTQDLSICDVLHFFFSDEYRYFGNAPSDKSIFNWRGAFNRLDEITLAEAVKSGAGRDNLSLAVIDNKIVSTIGPVSGAVYLKWSGARNLFAIEDPAGDTPENRTGFSVRVRFRAGTSFGLFNYGDYTTDGSLLLLVSSGSLYGYIATADGQQFLDLSDVQFTSNTWYDLTFVVDVVNLKCHVLVNGVFALSIDYTGVFGILESAAGIELGLEDVGGTPYPLPSIASLDVVNERLYIPA